MISCRSFWFALSLVLLIAIAGCGGGSTKWNPNNVSVTVSPATTNVAVGGQVTLHGAVNNDCDTCTPDLLWSIQELQVNGATGAQCNWLTGDTPPTEGCPYGTLELPVGNDTTTATFHAPGTTGTVHIVAEWTLISDPPISKTATAAVTVQ
jgi:hypothetical protein